MQRPNVETPSDKDVFLRYKVNMSSRRSARLRCEQPSHHTDAFTFRDMLDTVPATSTSISDAPDKTSLSAPATLEVDCLRIVAEGAHHLGAKAARGARSPPRRRSPGNNGCDNLPKPDDVPGHVWNCEPDENGFFRWKLVKLPTAPKPETIDAIKGLSKAYDFGTKQGRERWKVTIIAALAADLRFNQGRMLTGLLTTLPVPLPAWVIQMVVGVFVRVVNLFQ
jgi:hypothetical protein